MSLGVAQLVISLAFGFITPVFAAAGLLAAGIPIVIHILNRRRFKTVTWAAMDFLLRAMKKNRRRLQFETWTLLAVRCLLLALLGLALARPLGCENSSLAGLGASKSGVHVIVIDNSYSMAYRADRAGAATQLDQAKTIAKHLIDRLSRGGESVAIVTAARPATAIGGGKPTYDLDAAKATIDRIEQTAAGTDLAGALQLADQIGHDQASQPARSLDLITDGTKSAWETPQAEAIKRTAADLVTMYHIASFNLGQPGQSNLAAIDVSVGSNLVTTRFPADFRATLRGYGPAGSPPPPVTLQWLLDGQPLPGGGTVTLDANTPPQTVSNVAIKTGGPHVITASMTTGDRLAVDDSRSVVTNVVSEMKVLIVEGERGIGGQGGSGAFLQLALSPPRSGEKLSSSTDFKTDSYVSAESIGSLELAGKVLGDYSAVLMTDVGQITATQADRLAEYVRRGGTLMWFMGEQVTRDNYNEVLVSRKLLPGVLAKRMSAASDQPGYLFDFKPRGQNHRLLGAFSGEDHSGLDTAQVFAYWQLVLPADSQAERVLNYLPTAEAKPTAGATTRDSTAADPAIVLSHLGNGSVIFYSTSAGPEWTSFPAKPAYVALMHELLAGSTNAGDDWLNRTVGQSIEVPEKVHLTGQPMLSDPQHQPLAMTPGALNSGVAFLSEPLKQPGIYSLHSGDRMFPIAVNPAADEADVRTLDNAAIKSALGDIAVDLQTDQPPPIAAAETAGNDFGWTVMLLVLCFVMLECFMAMRFGHTRRTVMAN